MFKPALFPANDHHGTSKYFFIFKNKKILVKKENSIITIPLVSDLSELGIELQSRQYLGTFDGNECYAGEIKDNMPLPDAMSFNNVLNLYTRLSDEIVLTACLALSIVDWDISHIFCSKCGNELAQRKDERAKLCSHCNISYYPKIFPAVIVAVRKNDRLLLARNVNFAENFYSVIAGFIENNESLEEAVKREVLEETNIKIKNISYFGSQAWPFTNSLMIAFTAEYDEGSLTVDTKELLDAGWFTASEMPDYPPSASIAGQLIEWFIRNFK